jgi:phosphoglycolate phosphatase
VLFDVDGVLLDSLTPHLKICEDKNKEYGLGLTIPDAAQFKKIVRAGVRISPMKYFFTAVGFPELFAEKANLQYQETFLQKYAPRPFAGVFETLQALKEDGLQLGIVTSNVKANVVDALGSSVQFFCGDCIFTKDDLVQSSKSHAIQQALLRLQVSPDETIYVGDQPADWEAAKSAGVQFLGVSYGWGISDKDRDFPVVNDISEVYRFIHNRNRQFSGTAV